MKIWMMLLGVVLGVLARGAMPAQAQAPDLPADLEPCRFNAYTERDDLIMGAVVLNFASGAGCVQNLNTVFPAASVGKLFIADYLYRQVLAGRASFDTKLIFRETYYMGGRDDCLNAEQIGYEFTLGYLGNIMISCSDNAATWMLMDYLGWENINAYIASLGIPDLGAVIPYSEVDRLKLESADARWAQVPSHLASQFYRGRSTRGLVPAYFPSAPRYSGNQTRQMNAYYLENYTYNSASPHALARYMLKLRDDLLNGDETDRTVAKWVFNTMLLTQRVFSTQYLPGTVYVGSKNGFDLGYRAEVNITVRDLDSLIPETLSIIIVRHRDITNRDLVPGRFVNVPVTDTLLAVAPVIAERLYPSESVLTPPTLVNDFRVRRVVLNTNRLLYPCYQNFLATDYLDVLQQCWSRIPSADRFAGDDLVGVGAVYRELNGGDMRMTVIYIAPDGVPHAYQMARFVQNTTAMAWFEEVSQPGTWRVDVFFNMQPIFSQSFFVEG